MALIGLKDSITGDTLCDFDHPILLERIKFAEAVFSRSIEPESSADKDKLASVLNLLYARRPDVSGAHRPGNGPDDDERHGQAAPGNQAAPHGARLQAQRCASASRASATAKLSKRRCASRASASVRPAGRGCSPRCAWNSSRFQGDESIQVQWDAPAGRRCRTAAFIDAAEQGIRGALESGEVGYPVMNVRARDRRRRGGRAILQRDGVSGGRRRCGAQGDATTISVLAGAGASRGSDDAGGVSRSRHWRT